MDQPPPIELVNRALEIDQDVHWVFQLGDGVFLRWELHLDSEGALASARALAAAEGVALDA